MMWPRTTIYSRCWLYDNSSLEVLSLSLNKRSWTQMRPAWHLRLFFLASWWVMVRSSQLYELIFNLRLRAFRGTFCLQFTLLGNNKSSCRHHTSKVQLECGLRSISVFITFNAKKKKKVPIWIVPLTFWCVSLYFCSAAEFLSRVSGGRPAFADQQWLFSGAKEKGSNSETRLSAVALTTKRESQKFHPYRFTLLFALSPKLCLCQSNLSVTDILIWLKTFAFCSN